MKVPLLFWENFELFGMFGLFGLTSVFGNAGLPPAFVTLFLFGGIFGLVVGKKKAIQYLAGTCAGCLSANIVSEGHDGQQISNHIDLFYKDSSKIFYNYEVDSVGRPVRIISWTKTYFLYRYSILEHHRVGKSQAVDIECFGPVLTDSDYGTCIVSLLAESFPFGRSAVVTLYDKNQSIMDDQGVQTVFYTMESARSRYALTKKQNRPMPNQVGSR